MPIDELGTIYLLCFEPPYKHAKHYLGWAKGNHWRHRVNQHRRGESRAKLVMAAVAAGSVLHVARIWKGKTRTDERRMHNAGNMAKDCPRCGSRRAWERG